MYYRNLDYRWYKFTLIWTVEHHANFRFELNKYRVKMIKKKPIKKHIKIKYKSYLSGVRI